MANKYVLYEQLTTTMNALAGKIKAQGYEQKKNLKALAYKDEIAMSDLSTELQTEINSMADADTVTQQINSQIASVYKPGGSKDAAFLATAPTAAQLGYVYNITEDFTTTADFKEGAGKAYTAGQDVAVVEIPGANEGDPATYQWNVLAGFIDQTKFADAEEFEALKTIVDGLDTATDAEIQAIINGIDLEEGTVTPAPNGDNLGY